MRRSTGQTIAAVAASLVIAATATVALAQPRHDPVSRAAQATLDDARDRLEAVQQGQQQFDSRTLAFHARLEVLDRQLSQQRLEYATREQQAKTDLDFDTLFEEIEASIDDSEAIATADLLALVWSGVAEAPVPSPSATRNVATLPRAAAVEAQELLSLGRTLELQAEGLNQDRVRAVAARTRLLMEHIDRLAAARTRVFHQLSPAKHSALLNLSATSRSAIVTEAAGFAANLLSWQLARAQQLAALPEHEWSMRSIGAVLLGSAEVVAVLGLLLWAIRRWPSWMRAVLKAMSKYVHLGGWPMIIARIAALLQRCGRPLLTAATAFAAYHLLDASSIPPEGEIAYILIFWGGLLRGQLQFVESFAEHARKGAEDRLGGIDESDNATDPAGRGRGWLLFRKTWRIATGYCAVAIIVLLLVDLATGKAVTYHVARNWALWGMLPLAILFLHRWRDVLITAYSQELSDRGDTGGEFLATHGRRVYGGLFALAVLPVLLVRKTSSVIRGRLSSLDTTRRVTAFLFRRQVEKRQGAGPFLTDSEVLPDAIIDQFPSDPLTAKDHSLRPACLDDIATYHERWTEERRDGSVMLVAGSGVGKSTVLRMLDGLLDEEVIHGKFEDKITSPTVLFERLTEFCPVEPLPDTEADLVAALTHRYAGRTIAIDDCHNLFLRQVGGFEAWRSFSRIVNETCGDIFWVLSCNELAWHYLSSLRSGMSHFRYVVEMSGWSEDELRINIMSRMRRTRFRTSFTDLLVTDVEGLRMSTQIVRTSRGYFQLLWDFTDGNPRLAAHFWLRSLLVDDANETVKVRLFSAPQTEELDGLPDDFAFVLTAVAAHENITQEELATIVNIPSSECRFALGYCRERDLVVHDDRSGRWRLTTHWQMTVIRYLKRKNLLY